MFAERETRDLVTARFEDINGAECSRNSARQPLPRVRERDSIASQGATWQRPAVPRDLPVLPRKLDYNDAGTRRVELQRRTFIKR